MPVYHRDCEVPCCQPMAVCPNCIESRAPKFMTVEVSGIGNLGCNACEDINGIYELEFGAYINNECSWSLPGNLPTDCVFSSLEVVLRLQQFFLGTVLSLSISPGTESWVTWRHVFSESHIQVDCMNWDEFVLPFASVRAATSGVCDVEDSVALVTSGTL